MMVESIDKSNLLNAYSQISKPSTESSVVPLRNAPDQINIERDKQTASQEAEKDIASSTQKSVDDAIEALQDFTKHFETHLNFSKDESTGHTIVRIVNSETDEVIRQIPSEEILRIASKMQDVIGVLFDKEY